uniref:Putative secreted protein n=1 Tax=Ixodes ricinus TaxID=34613 RepID=A0A6B0UK12_IXORI
MVLLAVGSVALVGKCSPAWVEGVPERVVEEVGHVRHVDVGVAEQAPRKVGRVVVGAEDAAEVGIEQGLGGLPKLIPFLQQLFNEIFNVIVILHLFNKVLQRLKPTDSVAKLL